MKTILVLIVSSLGYCYATAQVSNPTAVRPTSVTLQPIPSTKAVAIRKDTKTLKVQLQQLNDSLSLMKRQLDALTSSMKKELDSKNEMTEAEQLRLQMAMDKMSKLMSIISNMLKKVSDTQQSIISNLKG